MSNLVTHEEIQSFLENYKAHMLNKQQANAASDYNTRRTIILQVGRVVVDAWCFNDDNEEGVYDFLHVLVNMYATDEILECSNPVFDFAVNLSKIEQIATLKFNKAEYEKFLVDIVVRDDCWV